MCNVITISILQIGHDRLTPKLLDQLPVLELQEDDYWPIDIWGYVRVRATQGHLIIFLVEKQRVLYQIEVGLLVEGNLSAAEGVCLKSVTDLMDSSPQIFLYAAGHTACISEVTGR